jgi:hypothetical protein
MAAQMRAKHLAYLVLAHAENRNLGRYRGCVSSGAGSRRLLNGLRSTGLNGGRRGTARFDETGHNKRITRRID